MLLTPAEQEKQQAEEERQRADRAELQVAQIARNLLQTGIAEAQVLQVTGLTAAQLEAIAQSL